MIRFFDRFKIPALAAVILAFAVYVPLAFSAEYMGAKKCSICHKKPEQGEQYKIWLDSAHAKAFETLGSEESKKVAADMGISDPQSSGKCLKCHATSYNFTEVSVTSAVAVEEGVSCESCHGPGKDYSKKAIMEDREKAVAAGMWIPDESTCVKCHNEESPTFKPFNYAERWEEIKHPVPKG